MTVWNSQYLLFLDQNWPQCPSKEPVLILQSLSLNSKERIEEPSLHIILEWETVAMSLYLLSLFYYLYSKEKSSIFLKKWKRWYFNTVWRNTSWKNCLTIFIPALTSKPWNVWLLHFKLWNIRFYPVDNRKI